MSHVNISYDKITYTTETININNFDLSVPGKELLTNSKLSLSSGSIYGLIGKNGSGKSSLLKKLVELKQDSSISMKISTLYVEQEIDLDERNPVDFVLDSNYKQKKCQEELDKINRILESEECDEMDPDEYDLVTEKARELAEILKLWNSDLEHVKVVKILSGLGFTESDLVKPSKLFSGGWQMRISLARSLYLEPDILLLDEPTNHLDLEAIIWLGDYLNEWTRTVIVVSHNIGFLNEICDYILNIEDSKQLVQYKGNYYGFKQAWQAKQKEAEKEWEKYEKKLKELRKKGTEKSKIDEFIKKNEVKKPEKPYNVSIQFSEPYQIKSNLITLSNVSFGYSPDKPILSGIDVGLDMGSKIVLVGPNGSGKSTLIKLMTGEIEPTSGEISVNTQARIGYYNQHFENQLPLDKTPIEYLQSIIPKDFVKDRMVEQSVRSYLGQVKLEPSAHHKTIGELSGGQKARVAIIKLIFIQPHVLILDEPTNHLDIETVESLIDALVDFKGGILVITHEPELIEKLDGVTWMMESVTDSPAHTINRRIESYEKYCELILNN
jgi:ATP-binding cassette subfamily F protein 1